MGYIGVITHSLTNHSFLGHPGIATYPYLEDHPTFLAMKFGHLEGVEITRSYGDLLKLRGSTEGTNVKPHARQQKKSRSVFFAETLHNDCIHHRISHVLPRIG